LIQATTYEVAGQEYILAVWIYLNFNGCKLDSDKEHLSLFLKNCALPMYYFKRLCITRHALLQ
ncbi:MAG: hypothetical protein KAH20_17100, partial [Methylococcales bacterium]|nr:hypothetical protein [Methylococcales bacterium]